MNWVQLSVFRLYERPRLRNWFYTVAFGIFVPIGYRFARKITCRAKSNRCCQRLSCGRGTLVLKANERSKRGAEVVMCSAAEIHFVSHVEANAHRTKMRFNAAARVEGGNYIARAQIIHGTEERAERCRCRAER